jgi:hypothetical protein
VIGVQKDPSDGGVHDGSRVVWVFIGTLTVLHVIRERCVSPTFWPLWEQVLAEMASRG